MYDQTLQNSMGFFLILSLSLMTVEIIYSYFKARGTYNVKETLCNLSILAIRRATQFTVVYIALGPLLFMQSIAVLRIPENLGTFFLCIILMDFLYYSEHRMMHKVPFFWAFHETHHSSPWFNLSTSYRLNFMDRIFGPIIFTPAVLLGFSIKFVVAAFLVNLVYQFFLHTQFVGKLPWLEGIINTPSAHRVHHGKNDIYLDKNFGGLFVFWDRLFGTYEPETEPVVYGTTDGFVGHNPIRVLANGSLLFFRTLRRKVHGGTVLRG